MWPNKDGSVTLSQRRASSHTQPQLDRSPQRIAQTHLAISAVSKCGSKTSHSIHGENFIYPLISALNFCPFFLSLSPPSLIQFQTQENSWHSAARRRMRTSPIESGRQRHMLLHLFFPLSHRNQLTFDFPQQTQAQTYLAFTVPSNGQLKHNIVWAISTARPPSQAADAFLTQHVDQGSFPIDLTQLYTSSDPIGNTPTSPPNGTGPVYHPPGATNTSGSNLPAFRLPSLLPYQRLLVIHAVLCSIGFLLVLPVGALVARWLRTVNRHWFKVHWITQLVLGGSTILAGLGVAVAAVVQKNGAHFDDTHKVGDESARLSES